MKNKTISLVMLLLTSTATIITTNNIHKAVRERDIETVKKIINNNQNQINAKDKAGRTPLYRAAT